MDWTAAGVSDKQKKLQAAIELSHELADILQNQFAEVIFKVFTCKSFIYLFIHSIVKIDTHLLNKWLYPK